MENAEAILVVHADTDHEAPVAGYHIKRAAKKGTPVIVFDVRKTDLSRLAAQWIRPRMSETSGVSYAGLINAVMKLIIRCQVP